MIKEESVPSAPIAAGIEIAGGRVFERIRRDTLGHRRCAPCDNSWIAVDRILFKGRAGLLFHRHHRCSPGSSIQQDLVDRDLSAVGFEVLGVDVEPDGQVNVLTADCPGVRLRALAEAIRMSGRALPREAVWHIVSRTAELCDAWREAGVEPLDTFVGFDGSLHLFPSMPACRRAEEPSYDLNEVWDCLLVDGSIPKLGELLCAELMRPALARLNEWNRALGSAVPPFTEPATPAEVSALLDGPRTTTDAAPILADLARACFPETYARHGAAYESLGDSTAEAPPRPQHVYRSPPRDAGLYGREREARILARRRPETRRA